ncbi:MAG: YqeG family HAD IIIA-type phosphatase [Clostridiales bacterium]|nr:YqeG family HAD IIIA-type phosphatase [Clostridiales bacterium]
MLDVFYPDIYLQSIWELPLEELKKACIRVLVFDIDNTLLPYDVAEPGDDILDFFKYLKKQGFKIILFSNNSYRRVKLFNRRVKELAICRAGKPFCGRLRKAVKKLGEEMSSAVIIGDQVFTDVLCGKMAGILTVLVKPICERDQLITKVKRVTENWVLKKYFDKVDHHEKCQ